MPRMILALLFCGLLFGQAQAQAPPSLVERWDSGLLVDTLHALSATEVQSGATADRPTITAVTRDGLSIGLQARGCDTPNPLTGPVCHAIEAVVIFDLSQRPDRAALADQLNHSYALGKFTLEPDGSLRATRYILLDGGVSQDNLRQELVDFFTVGVLARRTIWPQAAN